MEIYTVVEAIIGIAVWILLIICTKKDANITYGKLDKAGRVTNLILAIVYVCASPLYLFIGMLGSPRYDGFLGILGWIVAAIAASAALFCGVGLGLSVALRRKGKSKASFIAQFAGAAGILLTVLLFFAFYGNLLRPLN